VTTPTVRPKNVIVILLDSLNRHMVGAYGGDEFETPNLDRLAARSIRFTNHHTGSLPCMPARHDILVGALDFLWRPWGSIEVWEDAITHSLRLAGVTSMLVSDHPHLFEAGGENYHCDFTAWQYSRGHEGDPWKTTADPSWMGAPALPARAGTRWHMPYDDSRTWFREEEDFPGPHTMASAARWLRESAGQHERFFLFVDEFDPHEPFDTPPRWFDKYDPDWDGERIIWPPYVVGAVAGGTLTEREAFHVRANYGAKLSMIDHWLGEVLDVVDELGLWDDTAFVLCTDHGHYLGEHDAFGKPNLPIYNEMGHIPLLVAWPGAPARTCDALTTSVDIHATIADVFSVVPEHRVHGRSLVPVLDGAVDDVREHLVTGIWGCPVHVIDKSTKYGRAPSGDNFPLVMWSNRWSTMPIHPLPQIRLPRPDRRATLDHLFGSDVPVIRQPFAPGDPLPYWAGRPATETILFDRSEDPAETANLVGDDRREKAAVDLLRAALEEVDAPKEQLERLGVA
jgi:arylsulfatase A-like enzyme